MRVLVIGGGAREHALIVALRADPDITAVHCAPGNAGIAVLADTHAVDPADPTAVADLAVAVAADLVVIGPEVPLVAGAADAVRERGIACFGPSAAAARLEGSKAFAKQIMAEAGVPTAGSVLCRTTEEAAQALDKFDPPYVVKDDGLAAGKGVVVTINVAEALAHAGAVITSGHPVVVEEFLAGPEVSIFGVTDGLTVLPLLPAQDFKRIGDGDTGPNTGGMGAYCPLDWLAPGFSADITRTVLQPTVAAMAARGTPFAGLLYAGLVLTAQGPKVIEFNARFGDPETQVVLALLDSPLGGLLYAAATGSLAEQPPLRWRPGAAVTVVLAAAGYPAAPRLGDPIVGADTEGVLHAGTRRDADGTLRSAGGRVLSVTATGADRGAARASAYQIMARIELAGGQYRTDIAASRPT